MIRQKRQAVQADSALREIQQLIDRGDYATARRKIRSRLLFSSASSTLLHEAARLERRAGNFKAAISYYQRLLALSAQDAGALNGLGLAWYDSGDWQQAEHYYQRALHVLPDYTACLNNYAILLHKQFRHQEAIGCYQRVLAHNPHYHEAAYGLSTVYAHIGQLDEAASLLRNLLQHQPEEPRWQNTLGMVLLRQGEFSEGWQRYQYRYHAAHPDAFFRLPTLTQHYWQGEPLAGKTIVILSEQGLGDIIQFSRYVTRLKREKQAAQVIFLGRPELHALLLTLPDIDRCLTRFEELASVTFDCWCMLLDLPAWFLTRDPFGPLPPLFQIEAHRTAQWQLAQNSEVLHVGVVWKGNSAHKNDVQRSLAHFNQLAPLWQVPGIRWVSLQKGAGEDEVLPCAVTQPALALGPRFHDYADTASAIAQLDLVISVDTSVAHLAGSMGKPCWIMVPGIATDWRWTAGREDSLWYPQMRLFYRHQDEGWAAVIARIACALETWVKQQ